LERAWRLGEIEAIDGRRVRPGVARGEAGEAEAILDELEDAAMFVLYVRDVTALGER
jgi:hypothetical protein